MGTTAALTLLSFTFAFVVGLAVSTCRLSPVPPLRLAGAFYVQTVRNTPLFVLFVLFFFGLPKVGIQYSPFISAVVVLSAYTGAFVAETVRAGANAVSPGQAEAARALGLNFSQVLLFVVLPQALRSVVAPLGSVFIALIKNSGVATTIAVGELTNVADRLSSSSARPIPVFIGSVVAYLVLSLPCGWAIGVLERRVAIRR